MYRVANIFDRPRPGLLLGAIAAVEAEAEAAVAAGRGDGGGNESNRRREQQAVAAGVRGEGNVYGEGREKRMWIRVRFVYGWLGLISYLNERLRLRLRSILKPCSNTMLWNSKIILLRFYTRTQVDSI